MSPQHPGAPGDGPPVLAVEDVSASYGSGAVLHRVSFSVAAGELCGLIGTNGAGKTTLFRVILGLLPPGGGRVLVAGRERTRRDAAIGYVPQKIQLEPDAPLRVRDLVALGIDGHRLGMPLPSVSRRRRVDDMLAAVGATRLAGARVGSLSGGEQQRVMIAHALIARPKLLLLDEPLANLDLRAVDEVVALLARISSEHGVAVLLSAHDVNPLLPVMDRVVYLASGHAASGTTHEVVTSEVLSRLYGSPIRVLEADGRLIVLAGDGPGVPAPRSEWDKASHP